MSSSPAQLHLVPLAQRSPPSALRHPHPSRLAFTTTLSFIVSPSDLHFPLPYNILITLTYTPDLLELLSESSSPASWTCLAANTSTIKIAAVGRSTSRTSLAPARPIRSSLSLLQLPYCLPPTKQAHGVLDRQCSSHPPTVATTPNSPQMSLSTLPSSGLQLHGISAQDDDPKNARSSAVLFKLSDDLLQDVKKSSHSPHGLQLVTGSIPVRHSRNIQRPSVSTH